MATPSFYKKIARTLLFILIGCAPLVYAATNKYPQLLNDFSKKEAQVLYVEQGIAYINLGAADGVKPGQILVLIKNEKIKETLTIKRVVGQYRVIQSKKAVSLVAPVKTQRKIVSGDVLVFNQNLKSAYIDVGGNTETTYVGLRKKLSNLLWANYVKAKDRQHLDVLFADMAGKADLFFIYDAGTLYVRDAKYQLIDSYAQSTQKNALSVLAPAVGERHQSAIAPSLTVTNSAKNIGYINSRVTLSDYMFVNGVKYLVTSDGNDIRIFTLDEQLKPVATLDNAFSGAIINIGLWQSAVNKPVKITVSVWKDKELSVQSVLLESYILNFDGHKLAIEKRNIPYLLGSFDLDGDEVKETLLAQSFSSEYFFGKKFQVVSLSDNKEVEYQPVSFRLPTGFNVTGSALSGLTGSATKSITINNNWLQIASGKDVKLRRKFFSGAGMVSVLYELEPELRDTLHDTAIFDIAPARASGVSAESAAFIVPGLRAQYSGVSFGQDANYEYQFELFSIDKNNQVNSVLLPIHLFGRVQGVAVSGNQLILVVANAEATEEETKKTSVLRYLLKNS